ncbi:hypothetical protein EBU24_02910, partial [bacterium]|nr:hypothetical protein [bacterium]
LCGAPVYASHDAATQTDPVQVEFQQPERFEVAFKNALVPALNIDKELLKETGFNQSDLENIYSQTITKFNAFSASVTDDSVRADKNFKIQNDYKTPRLATIVCAATSAVGFALNAWYRSKIEQAKTQQALQDDFNDSINRWNNNANQMSTVGVITFAGMLVSGYVEAVRCYKKYSFGKEKELLDKQTKCLEDIKNGLSLDDLKKKALHTHEEK